MMQGILRSLHPCHQTVSQNRLQQLLLHTSGPQATKCGWGAAHGGLVPGHSGNCGDIVSCPFICMDLAC